MTTRSKQSKTKHAQEILPTSQKLDAVLKWLQKMLDAFPQKGKVTQEEIEDWCRDLTPFSLQAIDFAFESHRRNALFFPLYGQILDLCISYDPPEQQVRSTANCDAICKARHGKGYGWRDMYAAYELMRQAVKEGRKIDSEEILKIINSKREGGAPEFRREAA